MVANHFLGEPSRRLGDVRTRPRGLPATTDDHRTVLAVLTFLNSS
jgi:hypothetical protein